jgi:hypothetical protein
MYVYRKIQIANLHIAPAHPKITTMDWMCMVDANRLTCTTVADSMTSELSRLSGFLLDTFSLISHLLARMAPRGCHQQWPPGEAGLFVPEAYISLSTLVIFLLSSPS